MLNLGKRNVLKVAISASKQLEQAGTRCVILFVWETVRDVSQVQNVVPRRR